MRGLLVLLAVVAVASAAVPKSEKNIIDDILAVRQCLEDLSQSVQSQIANILNLVNGFQDDLNSEVEALGDCTNLGSATAIAECIVNTGNAIRDLVASSVLQIQQSISGLLSASDELVACFSILG